MSFNTENLKFVYITDLFPQITYLRVTTSENIKILTRLIQNVIFGRFDAI